MNGNVPQDALVPICLINGRFAVSKDILHASSSPPDEGARVSRYAPVLQPPDHGREDEAQQNGESDRDEHIAAIEQRHHDERRKGRCGHTMHQLEKVGSQTVEALLIQALEMSFRGASTRQGCGWFTGAPRQLGEL